MSAVSLCAVDKVLHHSLVDLTAQLEVVHEDVLHGDCFKDLTELDKNEGTPIKSRVVSLVLLNDGNAEGIFH